MNLVGSHLLQHLQRSFHFTVSPLWRLLSSSSSSSSTTPLLPANCLLPASPIHVSNMDHNGPEKEEEEADEEEEEEEEEGKERKKKQTGRNILQKNAHRKSGLLSPVNGVSAAFLSLSLSAIYRPFTEIMTTLAQQTVWYDYTQQRADIAIMSDVPAAETTPACP